MTMTPMPADPCLLSFILPVFNEEAAVDHFYEEVTRLTLPDHVRFELVFIDDGSTDQTVAKIEALLRSDDRIKLVQLSRNFGKEPALMAGLSFCRGDVAIPFDVDLQDPLDLIPEMLQHYFKGFDVVLAQRTDRQQESFSKRLSAGLFYKTINLLAEQKINENVGDFRLLSRKVVDTILQLPETQLFMKGVFSWVGFKTSIIPYTRRSRTHGSSKFNVFRLWRLALEGITSSSTLPLRVWSYFGFAVAGFAFIWAVRLSVEKIFFGNEVPGYPSIMVAILFLGGVQLIGIGVLGEYLGRTYMESKRRPRFIVQRTLGIELSPVTHRSGTPEDQHTN